MNDRLESGTVVDARYRIDHLLGSGGMADVYCATDLQLGRTVALKILYTRFAQDEEFVERFRREASAAAGLQHQHIVSVYDRGEWGGTYYIAMEHLTGQTLKAVIQQRGPLPEREAIALTSQVLLAARFAHKRGVVHRDFKPHNVLVDDEGRATVTDFGIARAGASEMTQTGSIMGTAQYLSPEQAQGQIVGASSDLYSIGVLLFELLTGRVPFEGESAVAIALKHVTDTPPAPSAINPAVGPAMDAVVLKALQKDPAARFANADEFLAALEAAGNGQVTEATMIAPAASYAHPVTSIPAGYEEERSRTGWIVAGSLALIAAIILAIVLLGGSSTKQVTVPTVTGTQLTAAQARLEARGFKVSVVRRADAAPSGEVLTQDPLARARADEGSTVTLTVSSGPGRVSVPPVADLSEADARKVLAARGLTVSVEQEASADIAKGTAIRTDPPAGERVVPRSPVTLFVSSGVGKVTVPSLIGKPIADARSALRDLGLSSETTETEDASADPGTVLRQTPAANSEVEKGSSVALVVAKAPADVRVPTVTGQTLEAATQALEDAGFTVTPTFQDTTDAAQDGTVLSQTPASGSAKPGSAVTLVVARLTTAAAPDTGGSSPDNAAETP